MRTRKLQALTIVLTFILASAGLSPALSQFSGEGAGTEEDPYIIINVEQLQEMSNYVAAHFELGNDIDATETAEWNEGEGFKPIEGTFTGSLDGSGFSISGLTVNRPESQVGLFSSMGSEGKVSNLGLEDITYIGDGGIGGIAGVSRGTISDSYATGNIMGVTPAIGGLVGNLTSSATITNSHADVNVEGEQSWVGGLAGLASGEITASYATGNVTGVGIDIGGLVGDNQGTITDTYATGNVNGGDNRVGGLVGRNHSVATITGSYATGNVNGDGTDTGGLVGRNNGTITLSSSSGEITGNDETGGLVGRNGNSGEITASFGTGNVIVNGSGMVGGLVGNNTGVIRNSYATGNVMGDGGFLGGFAGNNTGGEIESSYAAGKVSENGFSGGFAGANSEEGVASSYWNSEMNPELNSVGFMGNETGISGNSSVQMTQQSSFDEWGFGGIWTITEGSTYPWLQENQQSPPPMPELGTGTESDELVSTYKLFENYPNPFNPSTEIRFAIPEQAHVSLTVYNLIGQQVATLVNENRNPGLYYVSFDASGLSSGVFLYRFEAGDYVETRQMMFVK